jgi:hypothetical protein
VRQSLSQPTPHAHTYTGEPAIGLFRSPARLDRSSAVPDIELSKSSLSHHILRLFNLDFAAPQSAPCILPQSQGIVEHFSLTSVASYFLRRFARNPY